MDYIFFLQEVISLGKVHPMTFIESDIRLHSIFNSLLVGIFVIHTDGRIEKVNDAVGRLFQSESGDLEGRQFSDIVVSEDRQHFIKLLEKMRNTQSRDIVEQSSEIRLLTLHDKPFTVELEFIHSEIDGKQFIVGIIKDLSRSKELKLQVEKEKSLRQEMNQKLEKERELGQMKSRFVSIASHEFRTPLAGALSSLHLIKRYLEAEGSVWNSLINRDKIENHFKRIEESIINLNHLLDEFLSLNKLEENKVEIRKRSFDLKAFIAETCEDLKAISKPGQKITHQHEGNITAVYMDQQILLHILNNLISNALKYSEERQEVVVISSVDESVIKITVKDQGIGIPEAEKERLFSRFFRASNVLENQGSGLGLSIVKRYTQVLNGKVEFSSVENKGSVFTVQFPAEKA